MTKKWYATEATRNGQVAPLVIVRFRPDHLVISRFNLTHAAEEYGKRPEAIASGGNYLALWGPPNLKAICSTELCPNKGEVPAEKIKAQRHCHSNGRLEDQFAFGTPRAFDIYAAPYHPFQTRVAEEYVTLTLPLGNIVQVGAAASSGGVFGSLGSPGSCHNRMGHFPMNPKSTSGFDSMIGFPATFLEYDKISPGHFDLRQQPRPGPENEDLPSSSPFWSRGRFSVETSPMAALTMWTNFASHSFDQLCAPLFYFTKTGVSILRFTTKAVDEAAVEAEASARQGSCPPFLLRESEHVSGTGGMCVDSQNTERRPIPPCKCGNPFKIPELLDKTNLEDIKRSYVEYCHKAVLNTGNIKMPKLKQAC